MAIPLLDGRDQLVCRLTGLFRFQQIIGNRQHVSALRVASDGSVRTDELLLKSPADGPVQIRESRRILSLAQGASHFRHDLRAPGVECGADQFFGRGHVRGQPIAQADRPDHEPFRLRLVGLKMPGDFMVVPRDQAGVAVDEIHRPRNEDTAVRPSRRPREAVNIGRDHRKCPVRQARIDHVSHPFRQESWRHPVRTACWRPPRDSPSSPSVRRAADSPSAVRQGSPGSCSVRSPPFAS